MGALRYTPAGVPVIEFRMAHHSRQIEAGVPRRVDCEMACIAIGPCALLMQSARLGNDLTVKGFLAARSVSLKRPILHVTHIDFDEKFWKDKDHEHQTQRQEKG